MTLIANYPSKKACKESIGEPLKYIETSIFGAEYTPNGTLRLLYGRYIEPLLCYFID